MSERPTLVRLSRGLMVSPDLIERAKRCGGYTEVWLKGNMLESVWDEHGELWHILEQCAVPSVAVDDRR